MATNQKHTALDRYVLTAHLRQAKTVLRQTKEIETMYLELERLVARYRLQNEHSKPLFDATSGLRVWRAVYRAILENQSDDPVSEQTATRDLQCLTNPRDDSDPFAIKASDSAQEG